MVCAGRAEAAGHWFTSRSCAAKGKESNNQVESAALAKIARTTTSGVRIGKKGRLSYKYMYIKLQFRYIQVTSVVLKKHLMQ